MNNLDSRWVVTPSAEGGTDIDIPPPRGRAVLVTIMATPGILWSWSALREIFVLGQPLDGGKIAGFVLGVVMTAVALRHFFRHETWHLERNMLERRVIIGPWRFTRTFEDAELEIVKQSDGEGGDYYHLFAVSDGRRKKLLWRSLPDLDALAEFVSTKTGWPRIGYGELRKS